MSPTYTECGPSEGGGNCVWIGLEPEVYINNGCGADCKGYKSPVTRKTGTSGSTSLIHIHDDDLHQEAREPIADSSSTEGSCQASQLHRDLDARNPFQQVRCVRMRQSFDACLDSTIVHNARRWLLAFLVIVYDPHESIVTHDGTRCRHLRPAA